METEISTQLLNQYYFLIITLVICGVFAVGVMIWTELEDYFMNKQLDKVRGKQNE